jgi:uncharacterized membrane protein YkoI
MRITLAALALLIALTTVAAANVTIADARKVALQRVPGTIVHESESKKHHLFKFKIKPKTGKADQKVEVDAATGKVTKVKDVTAKSKG